MHVGMYVCMYVRTYACMYVQRYVYVYVCMQSLMHGISACRGPISKSVTPKRETYFFALALPFAAAFAAFLGTGIFGPLSRFLLLFSMSRIWGLSILGGMHFIMPYATVLVILLC